MSLSILLSTMAGAAAQHLGVLDSGESLSTQQLSDALLAANHILDNWTNEETEAINILLKAQNADALALVAKQARVVNPLSLASTLAGGSYTPPVFSAGTYAAGSLLQFADVSTTPLTLPNGCYRAFKLALALELAPQYDVQPTADLLMQAKEARAAFQPILGRAAGIIAAGAGPAQGPPAQAPMQRMPEVPPAPREGPSTAE